MAIPRALFGLDKGGQESREWFEVQSMVPLEQGLEILLRVLSFIVSYVHYHRCITSPFVLVRFLKVS